MPTEAEEQALLVWPPILVKGDVQPWERRFCASVIAHTRRGKRLTTRQAETLAAIRDRFRLRAEARNAEEPDT